VAATGIIQTVAGSTVGYSGDGGLATTAQLNEPFGVFVDSLGNIFIADTENSVVREVVASTGIIQTVAGMEPKVLGRWRTSGECSACESSVRIRQCARQRVHRRHGKFAHTGAHFDGDCHPDADLGYFADRRFAAVCGNRDRSQRYLGDMGGEWRNRRKSHVGTISTLGSYQAPASIPTPATVTVTAVANASGVASARLKSPSS